MTPSDKTDLPNPMPTPKPGVPKPGDRRDIPDQTPPNQPNPPGEDSDLPGPFKDDKAGQTATDQRGGKTVRGWEDIDQKGHDKGHGDKTSERDGQTGI